MAGLASERGANLGVANALSAFVAMAAYEKPQPVVDMLPLSSRANHDGGHRGAHAHSQEFIPAQDFTIALPCDTERPLFP